MNTCSLVIGCSMHPTPILLLPQLCGWGADCNQWQGPLHQLPKVEEPNLIAYLDWTHIVEWYVVRCGSKNKYQK